MGKLPLLPLPLLFVFGPRGTQTMFDKSKFPKISETGEGGGDGGGGGDCGGDECKVMRDNDF